MSIQTIDQIKKNLTRRFDPLRELFVAQSYKPEHLSEINLRTLTPYQRALLMIDGTVTKFVEAYTMKPVEIIRLSQVKHLLMEDHAWLEAPRNTSVITRKVLLRNQYDTDPLAYAVSLILPQRLSGDIREKLEVQGQGIGRLLLENRMQTYRELLWYGKEHVTRLPEDLHYLRGREFLSRTYRILANGQPLMVITEKFVLDDDRLPAHH